MADKEKVNKDYKISVYDNIIKFCLILFVFSSSFSIFISNAALYISFTLFLISNPPFRLGFKIDNKIYQLMAIFVAINVFSLFYGGGTFADISKIKNVMCFLTFIIAYEKGALLPGKIQIIALMLATNAILLTLAIILTAGGFTAISYFQDFANWPVAYSGLFSITITYGEFLVIILCIAFPIILDCRDCFERSYRRALFISMFLVNCFALILTYSRGPWLAFCICLTALLAWSQHKKAAAILLSLGLIFIIFILSPVAGKIPLLSDINKRITLTLEGYSSGRETIYATAYEMIKERPILGFGIGGVEKNYGTYVSKIEWASMERKNMFYGHLHNVYLQIWAECGLPGLLSFLYLIGYALWAMWKKYSSNSGSDSNSRIEKIFVKGAIAAVISMCLMGLTEYNFFDGEVSRLMWFFIGLSIKSE